MTVSGVQFPQCSCDTELTSAMSELVEKLVDKIFIAEDMTDAKSDGFTGGLHKVLSDGRVVWFSN